MTAQSSSTSQAPLRSRTETPASLHWCPGGQTAPSSRQSSGSSHAPATHTRAPLHSRGPCIQTARHILISTSHRPSPKQSSSEEHIPHRPSIHRAGWDLMLHIRHYQHSHPCRQHPRKSAPHYTVGRSRGICFYAITRVIADKCSLAHAVARRIHGRGHGIRRITHACVTTGPTIVGFHPTS